MGCCSIFGQHPYFSWNPSVKSYTNSKKFNTIDSTSIYQSQLHGLEPFQVNLGNMGSPVYSLLVGESFISDNEYTVLSDLKLNSLLPSYNLSKAVTEARYIVGSQNEQIFDVLHSQNFSKNLNFGISLNKINSTGFFLNQANNLTNFNSRLTYKSKNNKLWVTGSAHVEKYIQSLNGGLKNDSLFKVDSLRPFLLYEVNLENASQKIVGQKYDIEGTYTLSKKVDTTTKYSKTWMFVNEISFESMRRDYFDSIQGGDTILNTSFYSEFNNSFQVSRDTVNFWRIKDYFGLRYESKETYSSSFEANLEPTLNKFKQSQLDTLVLDLWTNIKLKKLTRNSHFGVDGRFLLNDRTGSNALNTKAYYGFWWDDFSINLKAAYKRSRPAFDLQNYNGNNLSWNENNFTATSLLNGHINLSYHFNKTEKVNNNKTRAQEYITYPRALSLKVNYFDWQNAIYFGYNQKPQQIEGFSQICLLYTSDAADD